LGLGCLDRPRGDRGAAQAQRFGPLVPPGELVKQKGYTKDAGRPWVFSLGGNVVSPDDTTRFGVTADSNPEFGPSVSLDYFFSDHWSLGFLFFFDDRNIRGKAGGTILGNINLTTAYIDSHVIYHWGRGYSGQVGFTTAQQNIDLASVGGPSFNVDPNSWNAWVYKTFQIENGRHPVNPYVGAGFFFNKGFITRQGGSQSVSVQGGLSYRVAQHLDLVGSIWAFDVGNDVILIGNLGLQTRFK